MVRRSSYLFATVYSVHIPYAALPPWSPYGDPFMPRTAKDARLDTRTVRSKLQARREPYWRPISEGLAIGYRKGAKGGTWVARHYTAEARFRHQALGTADDVADADGVHVLSFAQAQEAARAWFKKLAREDANEVTSGTYTVRDALADYSAAYTRRGGKDATRLQYTVDAHILPAIGDIELSKLTRRKVETWFDGIANTAPRLRTSKRASKQQTREIDTSDPDAVRKRRAAANRVLSVLKAALNFAHANRRVATTDAWSAVKPFREVDAPKVRYLSDVEARRLVNASPEDLRRIVTGALLTGCRYGELAAMKVGDFDATARTVHIGRSKGGKPRHVALTDEGAEFFAALAAGLMPTARLFLRSTDAPWKQADQFRPMRDACTAAKIEPAIGFHILRHTYASRLAMKGVPMGVIAAQLGHSDTRMTEKHYAHLAPSYVADTVRAAFGSLGIVPQSNVATIVRRA